MGQALVITLSEPGSYMTGESFLDLTQMCVCIGCIFFFNMGWLVVLWHYCLERYSPEALEAKRLEEEDEEDEEDEESEEDGDDDDKTHADGVAPSGPQGATVVPIPDSNPTRSDSATTGAGAGTADATVPPPGGSRAGSPDPTVSVTAPAATTATVAAAALAARPSPEGSHTAAANTTSSSGAAPMLPPTRKNAPPPPPPSSGKHSSNSSSANLNSAVAAAAAAESSAPVAPAPAAPAAATSGVAAPAPAFAPSDSDKIKPRPAPATQEQYYIDNKLDSTHQTHNAHVMAQPGQAAAGSEATATGSRPVMRRPAAAEEVNPSSGEDAAVAAPAPAPLSATVPAVGAVGDSGAAASATMPATTTGGAKSAGAAAEVPPAATTTRRSQSQPQHQPSQEHMTPEQVQAVAHDASHGPLPEAVQKQLVAILAQAADAAVVNQARLQVEQAKIAEEQARLARPPQRTSSTSPIRVVDIQANRSLARNKSVENNSINNNSLSNEPDVISNNNDMSPSAATLSTARQRGQLTPTVSAARGPGARSVAGGGASAAGASDETPAAIAPTTIGAARPTDSPFGGREQQRASQNREPSISSINVAGNHVNNNNNNNTNFNNAVSSSSAHYGAAGPGASASAPPPVLRGQQSALPSWPPAQSKTPERSLRAASWAAEHQQPSTSSASNVTNNAPDDDTDRLSHTAIMRGATPVAPRLQSTTPSRAGRQTPRMGGHEYRDPTSPPGIAAASLQSHGVGSATSFSSTPIALASINNNNNNSSVNSAAPATTTQQRRLPLAPNNNNNNNTGGGGANSSSNNGSQVLPPLALGNLYQQQQQHGGSALNSANTSGVRASSSNVAAAAAAAGGGTGTMFNRAGSVDVVSARDDLRSLPPPKFQPGDVIVRNGRFPEYKLGFGGRHVHVQPGDTVEIADVVVSRGAPRSHPWIYIAEGGSAVIGLSQQEAEPCFDLVSRNNNN